MLFVTIKLSIMEKLIDILNYSIPLGSEATITVKGILFIVVVLLISSIFLKNIYKLFSKKLEEEDKPKFHTIFNFARWLIFTLIFLISLHVAGVNVTAILASAAALLIGIGLALQTLFQDIFSGILILIDKTVSIGDIIEVEKQIAKVEEINLRTTRAKMLSNKVISIPNHLFLTKKLTNWTRNGKMTRENIVMRVAINSDIHLVKKLLIQAVEETESIKQNPPPLVIFEDIEESAFIFSVFFTVMDSFNAREPKSALRYRAVELFREHGVVIPFPQRDVHLSNQ